MREKIERVEKVTKDQVKELVKHLGANALNCDFIDIDYDAGRGVYHDERGRYCTRLWTLYGHPIDIVPESGGLTASQGNEVDPSYPKLVKK